jgi:Trk-type K+ transport system membrane component
VSSGLGAPAFMGNNALLLTMSALIMLGSIGFPILENFMKVIVFYLKTLFRWIFSRNSRLRRSPHLWNLNSKIVIISTFGLVLLGTLCFLIFEWSNLSGGVLDHIVQSFFMSVSPRTAGFGFYDMNSYTVPSLIVLVFLMWIGGGSQSTAGGVKVNTFAVSVINLWSVVRERSKVEVLGRELSAGSVNRANATIFMSIFVIGISVFMLVLLEPTINFKELFFEAMAALTTVGMGFGITEQLGTTSRLLVIILMFVGRIGLITLMLGLVKRNDELDVDFPKEDIIIT